MGSGEIDIPLNTPAVIAESNGRYKPGRVECRVQTFQKCWIREAKIPKVTFSRVPRRIDFGERVRGEQNRVPTLLRGGNQAASRRRQSDANREPACGSLKDRWNHEALSVGDHGCTQLATCNPPRNMPTRQTRWDLHDHAKRRMGLQMTDHAEDRPCAVPSPHIRARS